MPMTHESPGKPHLSRWRLAGAIAVPIVVVAALIPLRDHVRNTNLALVLVLVVLVAAVAGGRLVGLVVGLVTATAFDFFLTQPYQSFTIERADDIQTTFLLGAVGLIGGELVERARRSQADADARRLEIARFQRRAELAASGEPPGRLINRSAAELTDLLTLADVSYQPGPAPSTVAMLTHDGARVPGGPATADLHVVALPVRAHGRDLGHFLLVFPQPSVGMSVSVDHRHAAVAVADQLGMALLRYQRR
jgi:K+-sensing histidine kinase KdpD